MNNDYSHNLAIPDIGPQTLLVDEEDFDELTAFLEFNEVWFTASKQNDGTVFLIFDRGQDAIKALLRELVTK